MYLHLHSHKFFILCPLTGTTNTETITPITLPNEGMYLMQNMMKRWKKDAKTHQRGDVAANKLD